MRPDPQVSTSNATERDAMVRGWAVLKRLRARSIDLSRVQLLRKADTVVLRDDLRLQALLQALGLNDEGIEEFPPALHRDCGSGMLLWQFPIQFAPYLIELSRHRVRTYLEIVVRHGGSFVVTTEYL